jgi:putative alpha-1,2-mannosidase
MSAWYVFAALGLCPRTPQQRRTTHLQPGVPEGADHRENITVLVTGTPGVYVQKTRWNGRKIEQPWLPESFVRRGGVLRVVTVTS